MPGRPGCPCRRGPAFIDVVRHRPRPRRGEVVLAGQDQLHRLLDDVGDHRRLRPRRPARCAGRSRRPAAAGALLILSGVVFSTPATTAAASALELRAGPDLGRLAVGGNLGDRVHRLHLGVIAVLRPVGLLHGERGGASALTASPTLYSVIAVAAIRGHVMSPLLVSAYCSAKMAAQSARSCDQNIEPALLCNDTLDQRDRLLRAREVGGVWRAPDLCCCALRARGVNVRQVHKCTRLPKRPRDC